MKKGTPFCTITVSFLSERCSRIKGNFKIFNCLVFSILGFLKNILVNVLGYAGIFIMPFAGLHCKIFQFCERFMFHQQEFSSIISNTRIFSHITYFIDYYVTKQVNVGSVVDVWHLYVCLKYQTYILYILVAYKISQGFPYWAEHMGKSPY